MPKLDLVNAKQIKGPSGEWLQAKGQGWSWNKPVVSAPPQIMSTSAQAPNFQSTVATVVAPSGIQPGDLLIFAIGLGVNDTGIVTPPGMTRLLNVPSTSPPSSDGAIYGKIATDAEPESYTFNWTSSTRYIVSALRIANAALPPHFAQPFTVGGSGAVATSPATEITGADALLLDFVILGNGLRTVSMASGMTQVYHNTHNATNPDRATLVIAQREVPAPQVIAPRAYGLAPNTTWGVGSLVLRSA
jgi:hypothetical protein